MAVLRYAEFFAAANRIGRVLLKKCTIGFFRKGEAPAEHARGLRRQFSKSFALQKRHIEFGMVPNDFRQLNFGELA